MPRKAKKGERDVYDMLFLAFLFIGLGIGLAYQQAAAGLLIGAGVGVLARGYSKYGTGSERAQISMGVAGYIIALIGAYFIFLGATLTFGVNFLYPYNASIPLIIVGLALLILFFKKRNA